MNDWMHALAAQYGWLRRRHPSDELTIVFDIDGTILDMRHMMRHVLLTYDREYQTTHFRGLEATDIDVHENNVSEFLVRMGLEEADRTAVLAWYLEHRWTSEAIYASHRPYRGVLDVIRWFQIQPGTHVALNTGRPESLRGDTLRSLNALGREYRVSFDSQLLVMNPSDWEQSVTDAKVAGLRRLREAGYRIVAVIDNEPKNIEAMVDADVDSEILFLHADTLFSSQAGTTPRTVRGRDYDITSLVSEDDLPGHVQLVWHGVNDEPNLQQFSGSNIHWGEVDVRRDPWDRLVLRHDSFETTPWHRSETLLALDDVLGRLTRYGKGVKLDVKEGGELIDRVLASLERHQIPDDRLWFNGRIETLGEAGIRKIVAAHPGAIVQCPVDFLVPLVLAMPETARGLLWELERWGITRVSLGWRTGSMRQIFETLETWGYEVNIYDIPDLETFLQAALLLPRSLTADFNFPAWNYFGRGAGERRSYHRYAIEQAPDRDAGRDRTAA